MYNSLTFLFDLQIQNFADFRCGFFETGNINSFVILNIVYDIFTYSLF